MTAFIAQIWFNHEAEIPSRAGRFCLVEMPAYTFDAFKRDLQDDALIEGNLLIASKNQCGTFTVHSRRPILFRGAAIDRCHPAESFQLRDGLE